LTLKSINILKKKLHVLQKFNIKTDEIESDLITEVENEYVKIINLSRIIIFYLIQLIFDRSKNINIYFNLNIFI
jgi:hypothetical protein